MCMIVQHMIFFGDFDMSRVVVSLQPDEREALLNLANAELRTPRDQARLILIEALQRRGLLSSSGNKTHLKENEKRLKLEDEQPA